MAQTNINIRIDEDLKKEAEFLLKSQLRLILSITRPTSNG